MAHTGLGGGPMHMSCIPPVDPLPESLPLSEPESVPESVPASVLASVLASVPESVPESVPVLVAVPESVPESVAGPGPVVESVIAGGPLVVLSASVVAGIDVDPSPLPIDVALIVTVVGEPPELSAPVLAPSDDVPEPVSSPGQPSSRSTEAKGSRIWRCMRES